MRILLFAAAVMALAGAAHADSVDESAALGNSSVDGARPTIHVLVTGLDPNPISAATVTLYIRGDFDGSSEYTTVSADGYSFGRWLDNSSNDTIAGPPGDVGSRYGLVTGTATIPLASLAPRVGDGILDFTFGYSGNVGNLANNDYVGVRVQYQAPEPASALLLLLGAGFVGLRLRRRRQTG